MCMCVAAIFLSSCLCAPYAHLPGADLCLVFVPELKRTPFNAPASWPAERRQLICWPRPGPGDLGRPPGPPTAPARGDPELSGPVSPWGLPIGCPGVLPRCRPGVQGCSPGSSNRANPGCPELPRPMS